MQNKERIVLIKRNKQTTQRTNFHVSKFHSATCILKKTCTCMNMRVTSHSIKCIQSY